MKKIAITESELIRIFNSVDPAGIYYGEDVNAREYEPEAKLMYKKINGGLNVTVLSKTVRDVFMERFGYPLLRDGGWDLEIAQKILLSLH